MMNIRIMTSGDIPAGLSLCRAAGWNQLSRDWEMFLETNPQGCFVAENDTVAGTVTTIRYQDHFSWIGMLLVDPAKRQQGIGMSLFRKSLGFLQDDETVKLDATPAGRELYLKMNFVDEFSLSRMVLEKSQGGSGAAGVRPATLKDMESITVADVTVFGADRSFLLNWMYEGAPQLAFVYEANDGTTGYCFGRQGCNFTQIGPLIAGNRNIASNLMSEAINSCLGERVVIDVPDFDAEWKQWLIGRGFSLQRTFTRMYRGSNKYPGRPQNQYAVLGPEFG